MNFILEQILYMIILFITNPCKFYLKLKNIETLPFGREVRKIIIKDNIIYKYYRNRQVYQKNINYYHIMKKFNFIPRNVDYDDSKYLIIQQYKGVLLHKDQINNNIKKQLVNIFKQLKDNNIIILDIKPLFYNQNIINNITLINNKVYLIDYGDIVIKSKKECREYYKDYNLYYINV